MISFRKKKDVINSLVLKVYDSQGLYSPCTQYSQAMATERMEHSMKIPRVIGKYISEFRDKFFEQSSSLSPYDMKQQDIVETDTIRRHDND